MVISELGTLIYNTETLSYSSIYVIQRTNSTVENTFLPLLNTQNRSCPPSLGFLFLTIARWHLKPAHSEFLNWVYRTAVQHFSDFFWFFNQLHREGTRKGSTRPDLVFTVKMHFSLNTHLAMAHSSWCFVAGWKPEITFFLPRTPGYSYLHTNQNAINTGVLSPQQNNLYSQVGSKYFNSVDRQRQGMFHHDLLGISRKAWDIKI